MRDFYGVKLIIDLRDPKSLKEKPKIEKESRWAKELNLEYINIPVTALPDDLDLVLSIVASRQTIPILIHCQAGKDRTGVVVAFLRMQDGWTYEEAKKEMKRFGHNPDKHEVFHKHLRNFERE